MTGDGDDRHSISLEAEASLGGSAYVGRNVITLEGGAQNDRLSVSLRANATTTAKAEISGNHITIAGGADNDHLSVSFVGTGVAGNTVELLGGSGDDTLITDAVGANRLTLDGGDGIDTVQTAESRLDLRGVVLTSVEHITTTNAAGTAFTVDSAATALLVRGTGTRDSVTGTSFNITPEQYAQLVTNGVEIVTDGSNTSYSTISHTLDAGVTNLVLTGTTAIDGTGNALANSLTGNAAANILDGKGGSDLMRGGANNDTYWVDDARDLVIEAAGEGTDTVFATVSYALGAGQSIELLQRAASTGASNLNLAGNELANTLIGNDGANVLDGGVGADTMQGGLGNDTYWVDNSLDLTIEKAGQGTDTVISTITYTLRAGEAVEVLQLAPSTGTSNLNINGNEFANTLIGNDGGNSLNGGLGADIMRGGLGNDYYVVDNILDQVIELADQGNDTIISNIHYTLSPGQSIERLQLDSRTGTANLNLTGNDLANKIVGNDGNNSLDGKGGADTLQGGRGNDYYTVDNAADQTLEAADQGNDTVLSTISYKLMAGQSIERLQFASSAGSSNLNLTGNELANTITGNDGSNVLDGGAGADLLYGRGGADTFVFSTALSAANVDRVNDFSSVDDTIQLARSVFKVLPLGVLDEAAFKVMGTTAIDASDRILYNKSTGALFYDADGSGTASTAIQFAALDNKATLTAADFLIA
jgi:Ca2+-binding RTX toxin-like protein